MDTFVSAENALYLDDMSREDSLSPESALFYEEMNNGRPNGNQSYAATNGRARANSRTKQALTDKGSNKRTEAEKEEDKKGKITSKRAEQNRAAQRAFRERRIQYVKTLEEQLEAASNRLKEADMLRRQNSEMQRLIEELNRENQRLQASVTTGTTPSPKNDYNHHAPRVPDRRSSSNTSSSDESSGVPVNEQEILNYRDGEGDDYDNDNGDDYYYDDVSNGGSVDDESVAQAIYQNGYEPSPPSPEPYNIERLKSEAHQLGVSTDLLGQYVTEDGQIDLIKPLKHKPVSDFHLTSWGTPAAGFEATSFASLAAISATTTPSVPSVTSSAFSPLNFRTSSNDMLGPTSILDDDSGLLFSSLSPPALVPSMPETPGFTPSDFTTGALAAAAVTVDTEEHAHKRTREDAKFYTQLPASGFPRKIFTKNEQAQHDKVEEELCELLKKGTVIGEVDPDRCVKTKFMKKTTTEA